MSAFWNSLTKEKAARWVICLVLLFFTLYLFSPFIAAIILSGVFAFAIEPSISKKHRTLGALGVLALVLITVAIPITFFLSMFYSEINAISHMGLNQSDAYQTFSHYRHAVIRLLSSAADQIPGWTPDRIQAWIDHSLEKSYAAITLGLPVVMAALPFLLLSFLVFNLLLFLFLLKARTIKHLFLRTRILPAAEMDFMVQALKQSCRASLISTLLTGFMHAFIFTLASMLFRIGTPVIVFPITLLCSFLPVIGTLPIALTLIFLGLVNHQFSGSVGIIGVAMLGFLLDHTIRVYFMVNATHKIHPIISFVGILGAFIHYGLTGVIYGPLVISLTAMILPTFLSYQKRYQSAPDRKSKKAILKHGTTRTHRPSLSQ
jgi:predicted PurR-regulated permease PerM